MLSIGNIPLRNLYSAGDRFCHKKNKFYFQKKIVESQQIPISKSGDSLELMKLYTDEGLINIKKRNSTPKKLTNEITQTVRDNTYQLKEFAKLNANSLPIEKRVDIKLLDSILHRELR